MSSDRDQIVETVTAIAWHADHREWDAIVPLFADHVLLDYTSLSGGEPQTVTGQQIVDMWRPTFAKLDATQHLLGSFLVTARPDSAQAVATAQFIATHVRGDRRWTLGGNYRWELAKEGGQWRVTAMRMLWTWEDGDRSVLS